MFTFDRCAIMRRAHDNWTMHRLQGWLGPRATFADALRKAWDAAKYEAWSVKVGRTRSSEGLESTLETCMFLVMA